MTRRLLLLFSLCATACATYLWGVPRRVERDLIRIPHQRHLDAKLECLTCHEAAFDAKTLGERMSPPEKVCMQCHKERQKDCAFCHSNLRKRQPPPPPTLQMSHAAHIERVKEDCSVCHKKLPNPWRDRSLAPPMSACLGCHEHRQEFDEGKCQRCHVDLARYPLKPVSAFSHAGNFVSEHKRAARGEGARCETCHDQTFCADCHAATVATKIELKQPERVDRDFIHRNDFISRHALEASADPVTCARCHGTSFCAGCHTAQNLTAQGKNPRTPHPVGWALPGSAQFHGTEARRDIMACAACHDQGAASICVKCHSTGGIGGSPHPVGWSSRHPREEIAENPMCLICHR